MRRGSLSLAIMMLLPTAAQASVHYCVEEFAVGITKEDGTFVPNAIKSDNPHRYSIKFNDERTEVSGIQSGKTVYRCGQGFPTKAPDVVNCFNPLVATISFSISLETGRFTHILSGPGGWLSEGTRRAEEWDVKKPLGDQFIFGTCQDF